MCENPDLGCNCHHPSHHGRRCGRPHGGPNGKGNCDYCRNGHTTVLPPTAAKEIVSCVHAQIGQKCGELVFRTRGAEKEACGDTGYVVINGKIYCKTHADEAYPDWPNHLEV